MHRDMTISNHQQQPVGGNIGCVDKYDLESRNSADIFKKLGNV